MRRLDEVDGEELLSAVTARGEVVVEGHAVGHVAGFGFLPDPAAAGMEKRLVLRAARRALREWAPRQVYALEAAPDTALGWTDDHRITWDGAPVARLRPGPTLLRPHVEVSDSEFLDGPQRERVRQRLQHFVTGLVESELASLFRAEEASAHDPALRGVLHQIAEAGGVLPAVPSAPAPLRAALKARGVRAGQFAWFLPALLKPRAAARRAALWALAARVPTPALPPPGVVATAPFGPPGFAAAMGFVEAGPVLIRLDVAERVAAEMAWLTRGGPAILPQGLASRLAVRAEQLPAVLRALGLRIVPGATLEDGQYGPATPPMLLAPRRRTMPAPVPDASLRDGPFAALDKLKLGQSRR